jgi:hypothetical protein
MMDGDQQCEPIKIEIHPLSGDNFTITLARGARVASAKDAIMQANGVPAHAQELYLVGGTNGEEDDEQQMMGISEKLEAPCTLALAVRYILRSITVRSGLYIDQVKFDFNNETSSEFGDPGGNRLPAWELSPDEYIVEVSGHNGDALDAIQFVANTGRKSPRYGGHGGHPFCFKADRGHEIIGLTSSSGWCPPVEGISQRPL